MEHRYSQRSPANTKVLIYKKGIPVATGIAENTSRQGLFLRTEYQNINLFQPLEVELMPRNQSVGTDRIKTFVVHKSECGFGFGLEIIEVEDSALALLKAV